MKAWAMRMRMGWTHPGLDVEAEAADEDVAVGCHDRVVCELDFFGLVHDAAVLEDCGWTQYELATNAICGRKGPTLGVLLDTGTADQGLLELALLHVLHRLQQECHTCGISRELLQVLVGIHDAPKGIYIIDVSPLLR